jgi:hypothetical protein
MPERDAGLAFLLDFDGEAIVYDDGHTARFRVKKVEASPARPHGISYALTFHDPNGRRLFGYDNAHGVLRGGRRAGRPVAHDHRHRGAQDEGRPYRFVSSERLILDFFDEIERFRKERS